MIYLDYTTIIHMRGELEERLLRVCQRPRRHGFRFKVAPHIEKQVGRNEDNARLGISIMGSASCPIVGYKFAELEDKLAVNFIHAGFTQWRLPREHWVGFDVEITTPDRWARIAYTRSDKGNGIDDRYTWGQRRGTREKLTRDEILELAREKGIPEIIDNDKVAEALIEIAEEKRPARRSVADIFTGS